MMLTTGESIDTMNLVGHDHKTILAWWEPKWHTNWATHTFIRQRALKLRTCVKQRMQRGRFLNTMKYERACSCLIQIDIRTASLILTTNLIQTLARCLRIPSIHNSPYFSHPHDSKSTDISLLTAREISINVIRVSKLTWIKSSIALRPFLPR